MREVGGSPMTAGLGKAFSSPRARASPSPPSKRSPLGTSVSISTRNHHRLFERSRTNRHGDGITRFGTMGRIRRCGLFVTGESVRIATPVPGKVSASRKVVANALRLIRNSFGVDRFMSHRAGTRPRPMRGNVIQFLVHSEFEQTKITRGTKLRHNPILVESHSPSLMYRKCLD
jgi:hypothetical protein